MKVHGLVLKASYLLLIITFYSCVYHHRPIKDPLLLKALSLAGDNRMQLEKLLYHYENPQDSLKYKAAIFLIKYMPGREGKIFPEYSQYIKAFDTLQNLNEGYEKHYRKNNAEYYKFFKRTAFNFFMNKHGIKPTSSLTYDTKEDIQTITADYLIENIDYAFKAWKMPWNKNLSFDNFCEYILPYRYGDEELSPWRKEFYNNNINLLDSFKNEPDPIKVCLALKGLHDPIKSELLELRGLGNAIKSPDLIRINTTTSCKDETGVTLLKLRALGIPICRMSFPNWGNWGSGHDIIGVLNLHNEWVPLNGGTNPNKYTPPTQYKVAKLYVETYSNRVNSNFANAIDGITVIKNNYIDVTNIICKTSDITIPFPKVQDGNIAALTIFNNTDWIPITHSLIHGERANFNNIGRGVIYLPAIIKSSGELTLKGNPFLLDSLGRVKEIKPKKSEQSVKLYRKYPPNALFNKFRVLLDGCCFQGSNDSNFANPITLWKIDTVKDLRTLQKDVIGSKFKYFRLLFPYIKRNNEALAGIQVYYNYNGKKMILTGSPISSTLASKTFYFNIFDNDPLTFVQLINETSADFKQFYDGNNLVIPDKKQFWVGLKFKVPTELSSIELTPRTDDNDVNKDDVYELFYWDKDWVSLGAKKAISNEVDFKIPLNSLLLLKNTTKGKENRIFLYENGQQIWF